MKERWSCPPVVFSDVLRGPRCRWARKGSLIPPHGCLDPARTVDVSGNRVHLTAGRDPYRDGNGGPRTQPGSASGVERLDRARGRIVGIIEERFSQLNRDLEKGYHERVRQELPATIVLVEQARGLEGNKARQKQLTDLIRRSIFVTRPAPPATRTSTGFTKRLRPRP